ncbi:MAG: hypothetical protein ACJAUP_001761 [Cellvibrionaceae bacterium]|jgi:hypothetical protein
MSDSEIVERRNGSSLQYYLSLTAFFLSSLLLLVYLNFYLVLGFGDDQVDHLARFKKTMVELASLNRLLSDDVIKVEFGLDQSAFDDMPYYMDEIRRLQSRLQSFDGVGVPAPAKREIKRYVSTIQEKTEAIDQYKSIMEAYLYLKEAFYISRKNINRQINDESITNAYQIQAILDSVQRQVGLFLQFPDLDRKYNNIDFLKVSGDKLQKLAPDLSSSIKPFLSQGISLIENIVERRGSVEKILFGTDSYADVDALNFSLMNYKKDSNIFVLVGLVFLSLLTGFLFFMCIKSNSGLHSNASDGEEFDVEVMEGFEELMSEGGDLGSVKSPEGVDLARIKSPKESVRANIYNINID